ncbi:MAG: hypothetical protein IPH72_27585 [Sandaracinaceae bacterium]|nr:hypothetical protein [Sandaracinaceae bacterium]
MHVHLPGRRAQEEPARAWRSACHGHHADAPEGAHRRGAWRARSALRGNVLRIGGVKERCLIAHREGLTRVVLPARNAPDLEEVPKDILDALDIQLVNHVDEVLALVCEPAPVVPLEASLPA